MGFKKDFLDALLQPGRCSMEKIREIHLDRIVADCLSCQLQFYQCVASPVSHPVEMLRDAMPS